MLTTSEPARDALAPGSGETYPVAAPWRARQQAGASDLAFALVTAAIVFMPFLRPTGPGNSAPDDVLIVACVAATGLVHRRQEAEQARMLCLLRPFEQQS